LLLMATAVTTPLCQAAEEEPPVQLTTEGNIFRPATLEPTQKRIDGLKVPEGFKVTVFAKDLEAPRMMAVDAKGNVYVTRRDPQSDVLLLRNNNGVAEKPVTVAKIPHVHGIALRDGKLYLAAVRELYTAEIHEDGTLDEPKRIASDLPDAGQHANRTLRFSPDGELFLSVGSTCNASPEANPENATMLVVAKDGSTRRTFASGLRNTIGFDWDPQTKELWGIDHGIDWLGDEIQQEELNHIMEGKKYGWPFVYEDGKPLPPAGPEKTDRHGLEGIRGSLRKHGPGVSRSQRTHGVDVLPGKLISRSLSEGCVRDLPRLLESERSERLQSLPPDIQGRHAAGLRRLSHRLLRPGRSGPIRPPVRSRGDSGWLFAGQRR